MACAPRLTALLVALAALGGCVSEVDLGHWRAAGDAVDPSDTGPPTPPDPCLLAEPYAVDFGFVQRDGVGEEIVTLRNTCADARRWLGLKLAGDPGFTVLVGDTPYRPSIELATAGVTWSEPQVIAPGASLPVTVRYTPTAAGRDRANLIVLTDDPGQLTGLAIRLDAGGEQPCLAILPKSVDFAGVMVGRTATELLDLGSCGDVPLELTKLTLTGSATVRLAPENDFTLPVTLSPGDHLPLLLTYEPVTVSPGTPESRVWDVATLSLVANDFDRFHDVDVRGFGVDDACPTARIGAVDAEEVPVGTTVVLSGAESTALDGDIARWAWSVEAPFSAVSPFEPDDDAVEVGYRLAIAGEYRFALDVVDTVGRHACALAHRTVRAVPLADLRVELVWTTPNDPDPYDWGIDLGSDLDLHVAHPFAVGPDLDGDGVGDAFFDLPYDVFFDNPEPRWFPPSADAEDPVLVEDDQDGTGPEVVEVETLVINGMAPRIGVHAWDDHGFGPSTAVVRVFAGPVLIYESAPVTLLEDELWEVGQLTWAVDATEPTLVPALAPGGGPKIFIGVRERAAADK
ncbi:MAG: hypothetical protein EP329_04465 [Deltaproteobacteria bacterium]|nr:MAG: hypothetical protein EP329_04465 [Deltaproteobacteria bacterium]